MLSYLSKLGGGGGGGVCNPKKTERYRKFQIWDCFFSFFLVLFGFFGFSILANFDWFNGFLTLVKWFLLVIIAFIRHLQGFLGVKCVIRQFLASQDLIVDMIFEWLEFLVEVQTEKNRKSTTKNRKILKKKPNATANFKFRTVFFVFFRFFWVATPPPPPP